MTRDPIMRIFVLGVGFIIASARSLRAQGMEVNEPEFVSSATTIKIVENSTIHIPCQLTDMENTNTSWYRNGEKVADTGRVFAETPNNMRIESNHSLKVSQIGRGDGGEYVCEVYNSVLDKAWRQSHLVNVLYPQVLFPEPQTVGVDIELGKAISLTCKAIGNPVPRITWYFQKREIQTPNEYMTNFNVSKATKEHAGEYQCVADNNVGKPSTAKFYLRILYLPAVKAENNRIQSAIGQQAELSCYVNASPKAKVEWFRGSERITVGSSKYLVRVQDDKHTLLIKNMRYDDFTNYTCQGTNSIGRNSDVIFVSGLAQPAVFKASPRCRTETSYTLFWQVDSYSPVIQYNLRFRKLQRGDVDGRWIELIIPAGDEVLGPIQTQEFALAGLEAATVYEASVSSKNEFGWSSQSSVFRFATVGSDVENSSEIVLDVSQSPSSADSAVGDTFTDTGEPEENASWFTNAGCKRDAQVPLLTLVLGVIFMLS